MTSSNITTNQFVRIDQTPASIAERVIAHIIDNITQMIPPVALK